MKKTKLLLIILTGLFFSIGTASAESVSVLVEKGIFLQETKKDYAAAIDVYDKALKLSKPEGQLYEILYRMAMCSKGLGDKVTQFETLERLAQNKDQNNEWVKKAKQIVETKKKLKAPSKEVDEIRDKILLGLKEKDIALFHSVCNSSFKEMITPSLFQTSSEAVSDSLKAGYKTKVKSVENNHLGSYCQWWVEFEDDTKFILNITIAMGEVVGCWIAPIPEQN